MEENLKGLEELTNLLEKERGLGKTIVFTNGCFDILHKGHIYILQRAAELGNILVVGLNTDKVIRELKGPGRPQNNELDRAYVIGHIKGVDYVTFFNEKEPSNIISILKPDIHVKGGDYNPEDFSNMPEAKVVKSYGGKVEIIPLINGYSTTKTINEIKKE